MSQAIRRRTFLAGAGVATGAILADFAPVEARSPAVPAPVAAPPEETPPAAKQAAMVVLNDTEVAFLIAAVDTLIPADALSPSAGEAGVVLFIDRQLASAWGGGGGLYRSGPFVPGTPEQGYQLALTPRVFFSAGIAAVNVWCVKIFGHSFDQLAAADRIAALEQLERGKAALDGFSATDFFDALLQITMEGFFADPIYGGNHDMVGWRMLGFPGLPAFYGGAIPASVGKRYEVPAKSIADFL